MPGTGAVGRDKDAAGRSEQDQCPRMGTLKAVPVPWPQAPKRTKLPQSQVWVGYPPRSFVVKALATMGTLVMMDTLPPAHPLAQAELGVPRLVSVRTARLVKLRHVVAPRLPSPGLALGTILGAACLRMGTFSTSVSTFPSLVGPEVLSTLSIAGRWQGLLGLSRFWAQHLSQCLPGVLGHLSLGRKQTPKETDSMCAWASRDPGRFSTACTDISSSSPHAGTGCAGKSGNTTFPPRPPDTLC